MPRNQVIIADNDGNISVNGNITTTGYLSLPAGGYVDNASSLRYSNYSWLTYNTSTGVIGIQNATGNGISLGGGSITSSGQLYIINASNINIGYRLAGTAAGQTQWLLGASGTGGVITAGSFAIRNETAGTNPLTIESGGNATFINTVTATRYILGGALFTNVAQYETGAGSWGGGYNFDLNNGSPRHQATGALFGVWYATDSIRWYANTSQAANSAASERLRVDTNYLTFKFANTTANKNSLIGSTASSWDFYATEGGGTTKDIMFRTSGSSGHGGILSVKANGWVGVNTDNPGKLFTVNTPADSGNGIGVYKNGQLTSYLGDGGSAVAVGILQMYNSSNTETVRIYTGGNSWFTGGSLGVGTNSINDVLEVRGADSGITISSAVTNRPALSLVNGTTNILRLSANGNYGAIGDGTNADRYVVFRNGNIGLNDNNPAYKIDVNGTSRIQSTTLLGGNVGLMQMAMDGTRWASYPNTVLHIKTSILKGSDTMIAFNIRGYMYSPNTVDTDVAFYNYNPVSYVYGVTIHHKAYNGWSIGLYYSSDNYVCIYVDGMSTYGGFTLNWINTSLIQWGGRIYALASTTTNTTSAQY